MVSSCGDLETIFLGIGQQKKRGAIGLMDAVKRGIIENLNEYLYRLIMSRVTSLCTDGARVNIGEKKGLWKLIDDELKKYRSNIPFMKLWCSAHRMDLVWTDSANSEILIKNTLNILSSIASYFHNSSVRSEELKEIASEESLTLLKIPKIFEIRWTEWTYSTVTSVLKSWNVLMLYFKKNKETSAQARGFFLYLSKFENIGLITFLADVLHIYHRFQKSVQRNDLNIFMLTKYINLLEQNLTKLKSCNLNGGWEEKFEKSLCEIDNKIYLKDIELIRSSTSGFSKEKRDSIISTLIGCLNERFQPDEELGSTIESFIKFQNNADINQIHKIFAPDFSLASLSLQFDELCVMKPDFSTNLSETIKKIKELDNSGNYNIIETIFCRIAVCSPQTADVERTIKSNNLLKTAFRGSLSVDTENKYLFIYYNMPSLENWNPRKAITLWLSEKNRRKHTDLLQKETYTKSTWFKGIFENATKESENDQLEDIIEMNDKKIKF